MLEPLLRRLKDRVCSPALWKIDLRGEDRVGVTYTPMTATARWYRRRFIGTSRLSRLRLIVTVACGWVLRGALLFRAPSFGLTDPYTIFECGSGRSSAGEEFVGGTVKVRISCPDLVPKAVVFEAGGKTMVRREVCI